MTTQPMLSHRAVARLHTITVSVLTTIARSRAAFNAGVAFADDPDGCTLAFAAGILYGLDHTAGNTGQDDLPKGWRWIERGAASSTAVVRLTDRGLVRIEGDVPAAVMAAALHRFGGG